MKCAHHLCPLAARRPAVTVGAASGPRPALSFLVSQTLLTPPCCVLRTESGQAWALHRLSRRARVTVAGSRASLLLRGHPVGWSPAPAPPGLLGHGRPRTDGALRGRCQHTSVFTLRSPPRGKSAVPGGRHWLRGTPEHEMHFLYLGRGPCQRTRSPAAFIPGCYTPNRISPVLCAVPGVRIVPRNLSDLNFLFLGGRRNQPISLRVSGEGSPSFAVAENSLPRFPWDGHALALSVRPGSRPGSRPSHPFRTVPATPPA